MTEQSTRNEPLPKSGTLSPNPWDLTLSGQNGWSYTGGTRTEDRAPQGCDPSAASSAGMATGDFDAEAAPKHTDFDPSEANLLRAKIGLDKGVHFIRWLPTRTQAPAYRPVLRGTSYRDHRVERLLPARPFLPVASEHPA